MRLQQWFLIGILVFLGISESVFGGGQTQKVLFIRKSGSGFDEVYQSMKQDLEKNFKTRDLVVNHWMGLPEVKAEIDSANPSLMVLMDNQAVQFGAEYNRQVKPPRKPIPGVALLALNLHSELKGNPHFSGVAYEIPGYTLLTQFRYIVGNPIKNVLVLYRQDRFADTVDLAVKQLATEGIRLNPISMEIQDKKPEAVSKLVSEKLEKELKDSLRYDAVWVLLDSVLLSKKAFSEGWIPASKKFRIPFVTGVEELVTPSLNFAVFAVSPNLPDYAAQAVQQVEMILKDGVSPKDVGIENLISVNKSLNLKKVYDLNLKIRKENLGEVKTLE